MDDYEQGVVLRYIILLFAACLIIFAWLHGNFGPHPDLSGLAFWDQRGPQGPKGDPGTQILTGTGAPATTLGRVDDIYVDSTAGQFYKKTAQGWSPILDLRTAGPRVIIATGALDPNVGSVGDILVETGTGNFYEKTSSTNWAFRGTIRGAQGPAGQPGQDGRDGRDGRDGLPGRDGRDGQSGTVNVNVDPRLIPPVVTVTRPAAPPTRAPTPPPGMPSRG